MVAPEGIVTVTLVEAFDDSYFVKVAQEGIVAVSKDMF